jgi:predicted ATPase
LTLLLNPSLPATNVHVLIGRNGVGKTTLLGQMAESVCLSLPARAGRDELGEFVHYSSEATSPSGFANVLSVSFSAFDDFPIPSGDGKDSLDTRYEYIGLRSVAQNRLKTLDELTKEFSETVELCTRSARFPFWKKALETLSSDPGFESLQLSSLSQEAGSLTGSAWEKVYRRASAGHRLVLLTMAKLVEGVGERTLVLFDEPEAHLHPPLLGSFVRALSELLLARNGVAIMATHSPVVLQELPARCVLILTREGNNLGADRPTLETFGEALGILTHEVFGLEVKRSGHHALLSSLIKKLGPEVTYTHIQIYLEEG